MNPWTRLAGPLLGLGLLIGPGLASAQSIYRCGNSYGPEPCEGGSRLKVEAEPEADRRDAARSVADRERMLAAELARERLQRAARAVRSAAGIVRSDRTPRTGTQAREPRRTTDRRQRDAAEPDFIAIDRRAPTPHSR